VDTLVARMRESHFAWLAANVRTASGARPAWAQPWRMVRAGGLRVALIGYASILTPSLVRPDNVAGLRFDVPAWTPPPKKATTRGMTSGRKRIFGTIT
jgi:2',3'-cyclic-nucleotide 2'-phosphodiesterase (5'-nucleotidase family)